MKGEYRSRGRLVMDLLGSIKDQGPVGVTRLLLAANLTHGKLHELLASFEGKGWVSAEREGDRAQWRITERGTRVHADLRRIDAAMQDHGLGL